MVMVQPAGGSVATRSSPHVAAIPPGGSYRVVRGDTLYAIAFRKGVDFRNLAQWNRIAAPYTIWPGQVLHLAPSTQTSTFVHVSPHPSAGWAASTSTASKAAPAAATPAFEPSAESSGTVASNSKGPRPQGATSVTSPAPIVPVAGMLAGGAPSAPPTVLVPAGPSHAAGGVSWRWPASGSLIKRFQSGDAIPGIELAGKSGDPVRSAANGIVVYSGNGLVGYGELIIIKHNDSFLSAYGHNRKRLVQEGQRVSAGQQIAEMGSTGASRDELQFQIRLNGNPVDPLAYLPAR